MFCCGDLVLSLLQFGALGIASIPESRQGKAAAAGAGAGGGSQDPFAIVAAALAVSAVPSCIPCREHQKGNIRSFVERTIEGGESETVVEPEQPGS
jgi:hypothetical protein